jgi:uncharacterized protein YjeT (DUF2065 family)
MKYFLCVLGMVFVIEGLPYFAFPDKIKRYLHRLVEIPDSRLRIMGSITIAIGLLLIVFGRS